MDKLYEDKDRVLPAKRKLVASSENQSSEMAREESCKKGEETATYRSGSPEEDIIKSHSSHALKEEDSESPAADLPYYTGAPFFEMEQEELNDDEEDSDYRDTDDEAEDNEERGDGNSDIDTKGKGILIEESNSSDDDEDDENEIGDEDCVSEIEEDPLAGVDLDNILPTRTRSRRGSSRSGVFIGGNGNPSDAGGE